MTAERPEGMELDTELVPDLTTELAEAATADHRAEHEAAAAEPGRPARYAIYDTRLERYVGGVMSEAQADEHGYSKSGRYRLEKLDETGRLARFP